MLGRGSLRLSFLPLHVLQGVSSVFFAASWFMCVALIRISLNDVLITHLAGRLVLQKAVVCFGLRARLVFGRFSDGGRVGT